MLPETGVLLVVLVVPCCLHWLKRENREGTHPTLNSWWYLVAAWLLTSKFSFINIQMVFSFLLGFCHTFLC